MLISVFLKKCKSGKKENALTSPSAGKARRSRRLRAQEKQVEQRKWIGVGVKERWRPYPRWGLNPHFSQRHQHGSALTIRPRRPAAWRHQCLMWQSCRACAPKPCLRRAWGFLPTYSDDRQRSTHCIDLLLHPASAKNSRLAACWEDLAQLHSARTVCS